MRVPKTARHTVLVALLRSPLLSLAPHSLQLHPPIVHIGTWQCSAVLALSLAAFGMRPAVFNTAQERGEAALKTSVACTDLFRCHVTHCIG